MNKIVRSILNQLPDEMYISLQFRKIMGKFPNLKNPTTFNEKLQWLKLNDRNDFYTILADKYSVREYITNLLGDQYLVPLYGVYACAEDIEWEKLPDQFVLKCSHDSGSVIVCRDKKELDYGAAIKKLSQALKRNAYSYGREWPYKNIKPRIIAEKYLECGDENGLIDYKFYCFAGDPKYLYISKGLEDHSTARITFYDTEGRRAPFQRTDYPLFEEDLPLPANFGEMKELAGKIAKDVGSRFLRVDFYSVYGHVYFSEITFTPCSGYMRMDPPEWDEKLGNMLIIS